MFKQLLDNALDAIESNRHEPRELRIVTGVEEQSVFVVIEDSGPGVPSHLQWQIFEPFFTTSAPPRTLVSAGHGAGSGQRAARRGLSRS
ncbi:MAG: hypothetical protein H6974_10495 [Gammaproteobacteria bacterium]|nr:hypothetical protein [Gammaproteobacteria bacterium]